MTERVLFNLKGVPVLEEGTMRTYLSDKFVDEATYHRALSALLATSEAVSKALTAMRELKPVDAAMLAKLDAVAAKIARRKVWKPGDVYMLKPYGDRWIHANTPLKPVPCAAGVFAYCGMGNGVYCAKDGSMIDTVGSEARERAKAEGVPFFSFDSYNCDLVLVEDR